MNKHDLSTFILLFYFAVTFSCTVHKTTAPIVYVKQNGQNELKLRTMWWVAKLQIATIEMSTNEKSIFLF